MTQFIYFITNPGNEKLLKYEMLEHFKGRFNFSYSKPGLCTYKNMRGDLSLEDIRNLDVIFARSLGESRGILSKNDLFNEIRSLTKTYKEITFTQIPLDPNNLEEDLDLVSELESSRPKGPGHSLIQGSVIKVEEDKYFLGIELKDKFSSPPGKYFYKLSKSDSPSRAYHKIKESFLLLNIPNNTSLVCAEFGCAPGGSSKFLLENNHTVYGVDPAKMDDSIFQDKNFHFINLPMQKVKRKELPEKIDLLISDVNLEPLDVLKIFTHLFQDNSPHKAIITLKIPKAKMLTQKNEWDKLLQKLGYSNISYVQLSSHRSECVVIGEK